MKRTAILLVAFIAITILGLTSGAKPILAACSPAGGGASSCSSGNSNCLIVDGSGNPNPYGGTYAIVYSCSRSSSCTSPGPNMCTESDFHCGNNSQARAYCGLPYCGDGLCNNGETCSSCSSDCGSCPPTGSCPCGGTYPNCTACPPAPGAYGFGCSGLGCVWMSGGNFGGDSTCGNYSCAAASQTCQLSVQINPQPADVGTGIQFTFTEGPGPGNSNRGYVCVDLNTGGGTLVNCLPSHGYSPSVNAGCNNNNGSSCSWTFNCTAIASIADTYQTFYGHFSGYVYNAWTGGCPPSGGTDCSINFSYILHQGCSQANDLATGLWPNGVHFHYTDSVNLSWVPTGCPDDFSVYYWKVGGYSISTETTGTSWTITPSQGPGEYQFEVKQHNGANGWGNFTTPVSFWMDCPPITCASQGANCGTIPDGCGGTLDCGSCSLPYTCGGGGIPNICGGCNISISPSSLVIGLHQSQSLFATVSNISPGSFLDNITWTSGNSAIASVTSPGSSTLVTGQSLGSTTVSATANLIPGGSCTTDGIVGDSNPSTITITTSYFQTFGGDITAKGQASDQYLTSTKYVCTKSP